MNEKSTPQNNTLRRALQNRDLASDRAFLFYAYRSVTHAPLYTRWQELLSFLRRFRAVTLFLRVVTVILTVLETGAFVLLATALFLVLLPILLSLLFGILITAAVESRRTNRHLLQKAGGRAVYVLFMSEEPNPFLFPNARDLCARGALVLILSPYWISSKGLREGPFYCTARKEADDIYLVRRYYFFSLKKRVLKNADTRYLY